VRLEEVKGLLHVVDNMVKRRHGEEGENLPRERSRAVHGGVT
jgi:hypothetical protein